MRISLRELIGLVTIAALAVAVGSLIVQTRAMRNELSRYRVEVGYLQPTGDDEIAASRAPFDEPLAWKFRVRVPDGQPRYRLTYATTWPRGERSPKWYGAVPIEPGESRVTVRIMRDQRDQRWKASVVVSSKNQTRRMASVLPPEQVEIFRGSHQQLARGIDRGTVSVSAGESIRVLDQRYLVGEGSLMLFGDSPPKSDQIGVYAELQPDAGPL